MQNIKQALFMMIVGLLLLASLAVYVPVTLSPENGHHHHELADIQPENDKIKTSGINDFGMHEHNVWSTDTPLCAFVPFTDTVNWGLCMGTSFRSPFLCGFERPPRIAA